MLMQVNFSKNMTFFKYYYRLFVIADYFHVTICSKSDKICLKHFLQNFRFHYLQWASLDLIWMKLSNFTFGFGTKQWPNNIRNNTYFVNLLFKVMVSWKITTSNCHQFQQLYFSKGHWSHTQLFKNVGYPENAISFIYKGLGDVHKWRHNFLSDQKLRKKRA